MLKSTTTTFTRSAASSSRRRRRARPSSRCGWFAAASFLAALLKLDDPNSLVQCLLIPHQGTIRATSSSYSDRMMHQRHSASSSWIHHHHHRQQPHHHDGVTSSKSTTALQLFFDKFLHPYGVNNDTNDGNNNNNNYKEDDDDDLNQGVELLNALLPRLRTREERIEGFQRARLDEQLRLSKRARSGGGGAAAGEKEVIFLAGEDEDEEVSRLTDLFQRARLAEQLRLSNLPSGEGQRFTMEDVAAGADNDNDSGQKNFGLDKDEAFQRALLEERLRIIEKAMLEYESEKERESSSKVLRTMTMTEEQEGDNIAADVKDSDEESSSGGNDAVFVGSLPLNSNGNGEAVFVAGSLPLNQTEDVPAKKLGEKLEHLHQMVVDATASPSIRSSSISSNSTFSLQAFLSTTHLPLPPREDASFLSVALMPAAHLATSAFLVGAAGFYAVLAILDVIWNDNQDKHSTRACLKEASSVVPKCLGYIFPKDGKEVKKSAMQRTMIATKTSCVASFYAIQCIGLRAAKYSKYANECMEAGTGALRYFVYTLRSVKVVWDRLLDSMIGSFKGKRDVAASASTVLNSKTWMRWNHKLNPVRALFSKIKSTASQRLNEQRTPQAEQLPSQQSIQSEELYNKKLRTLNLDRVTLERDRQELQEAQRQLESERRQMLSEGVNVLAWYSAASEAAAVATDDEVAEKQKIQEPQKKKGWSLWGGKEGKQRSEEEDTVDNI